MPISALIDVGRGEPVVLVPGLQGRWEWMRATVDALAAGGRVVTCSLPGEPGSGFPLPATARFDVHLDQLDAVFAQAGLTSAVLCGVSYGGWVSVAYAARRQERVAALVLASAPGPRFEPERRQHYYLRAPRLLLPVFAFTSRQRMRPEVVRALPAPAARLRFMRRLVATMARAPISPSLMSRRVTLARQVDFRAAARAVRAPTLVLTGEPGLDRVVPVESTREYLDLVPNVRGAELGNTGHLGCVTRAPEFAAIVRDFARLAAAESPVPLGVVQ